MNFDSLLGKNHYYVYDNIENTWKNLIQELFKKRSSFLENDVISIVFILSNSKNLSDLMYIKLLFKLNLKINLIVDCTNIEDKQNDLEYKIKCLFIFDIHQRTYLDDELIRENELNVYLKKNNEIKYINDDLPANYEFTKIIPFMNFKQSDLSKLNSVKEGYISNHLYKYNQLSGIKEESKSIKLMEVFIDRCSNKNSYIKEKVIEQEDKIDFLTMFFYVFVLNAMSIDNNNQHFNDDLYQNDLLKDISNLCSGLYQLIENSCVHSCGKEAIIFFELVEFKQEKTNELDDLYEYIENKKNNIEKKHYYLDKYNFDFCEKIYAITRIIDRSLEDNGSNIISISKKDKIKSLEVFFDHRIKQLTGNTNFLEGDEIIQKYGLLMFLEAIKSLNAQLFAKSGDEEISIHYYNSLIQNQRKKEDFITSEYVFAFPLGIGKKTCNTSNHINKITVMDFDKNLDFGKIDINSTMMMQQQKYNSIIELSNKLAIAYSNKDILQIKIHDMINLEILIKAIANLSFLRFTRDEKCYIVIDFCINKNQAKEMIRKFLFYYKILSVKLKIYIKKRGLPTKEEDLQIGIYNKHEGERHYITTISGYSWNVILRSFINNILYNNEFAEDDYFKIYIDDINLIQEDKSEIKIFPFELYNLDGENEFVKKMNQIFENSSIKHENVNVLLGSGKYLDTFYEAEYIFRSRYLNTRLAILIKNDLEVYESDFLNYSNFVILGYADYSHLICELLKKYLNMKYPNIKVNIVYVNSNQNIDKLESKDNYYIGIIPISSSFNTIKYMNKILNYIIRDKKFDKYMNVSYTILNVNDDQDYVESEKLERIFHIKNINDIKTKVKYMITKKVNASNYPNNIPISLVDKTSTLQDTIYKMEYREHNFDERNFERFKYLRSCVAYGHYEYMNKHYLYYINYNKLLNDQEMLKDIEKDIIAKKIEIDILALNIVVSPLDCSNNSFLNLVLDTVFSGNAFLIQFDKKTYRENFKNKYSHIKDKIKKVLSASHTSKVNFYFVDTTISSCKTINRAKELINCLIEEDIDLIMKSKSKESIINPYIFEKVFLLVNRSSVNTLKTCIGNLERVYKYVNVHCPSFEMDGITCPDCKISENYYKLSRIAPSHLATCFATKAKRHDIIKIEDSDKILYSDDSFIRLCITHLILENKKIFDDIYREYKTNKDKVKCYEEVNRLKNTFKNNINKIIRIEKSNFDDLFIRVISRPFITVYESIKQISYIYMIIYFEKTIYDPQTSVDYIIQMMNRISYYGTSYINNFHWEKLKDHLNKRGEFFEIDKSIEIAKTFEKAYSKGMIK